MLTMLSRVFRFIFTLSNLRFINNIKQDNVKWPFVLFVTCIHELKCYFLLYQTCWSMTAKGLNDVPWLTLLGSCEHGCSQLEWTYSLLSKIWPGPEGGVELHLPGVPQAIVLGTFLFNTFISDLEEGIESTLCQFAADTKVNRRVGLLEGRNALRQDPDRLDPWTEANCLKFKKVKWWILHSSRNNLRQC